MARIIVTCTAPLFYFFVFFFPLISHQTMSQPEHMFTFCNTTNNFIQTSSYETNRDMLLSSLRESSTLGTYSNATIGVSPDTVHGMFLCRGDITATSCADCVLTATIEIATNCSLNKRAVIYYDECMIRYSDVSFFSKLEFTPGAILYSPRSAPNSNRFNQTLSDKFNQLILNVSSSSSIPYFVEDQERVTQPEGSYELESMVQCSPDLAFSAVVSVISASSTSVASSVAASDVTASFFIADTAVGASASAASFYAAAERSKS